MKSVIDVTVGLVLGRQRIQLGDCSADGIAKSLKNGTLSASVGCEERVDGVTFELKL
jgi:hypothetical protein